jgi:hypothetical protein
MGMGMGMGMGIWISTRGSFVRQIFFKNKHEKILEHYVIYI